MLLAQGIRLRRTWDTLQMARLAYGAERGGLRLAEIAADLLNLECRSTSRCRTGAPSACRSSAHIRRGRRGRRPAHRRQAVGRAGRGRANAFRIGNATVPAVAAMRLAGIPFDRAVHERTIAAWEAAYVQARDQFVALTGEEPPLHGRKRSEWLEAHLPEDMRPGGRRPIPACCGRAPPTSTGWRRCPRSAPGSR